MESKYVLKINKGHKIGLCQHKLTSLLTCLFSLFLTSFLLFLQTSPQRRRPEGWPGPSASRRAKWGSGGSVWKDTWVAGTIRWSKPWNGSRSCRAPWTSSTCGWLEQRTPKLRGSLWGICWSTLCRTTSTRPWWVRETTVLCAPSLKYNSHQDIKSGVR